MSSIKTFRDCSKNQDDQDKWHMERKPDEIPTGVWRYLGDVGVCW